jgi:hypothetical protein
MNEVITGCKSGKKGHFTIATKGNKGSLLGVDA